MTRLPVLATFAVLLLSACGAHVVTPRSVTLVPDRVLVRMDDNSLCRGPAPPDVTGGDWHGTLQDCPHPYTYSVAEDPDPSLIRQALEKVAEALAANPLLQPNGTVVVTDTTGTQHVFAAPPPSPEM